MGEVRGVLALSTEEAKDCEDVLTLIEKYMFVSSNELEYLHVLTEDAYGHYLIAEVSGENWISLIEKIIRHEEKIECYSTLGTDCGTDYYFSFDRKGNQHMTRFDSESHHGVDADGEFHFKAWKNCLPNELFDQLSAYL